MDPLVEAAFGPPLKHVNMHASTTAHDNTVIIVLAVMSGLTLATRLSSRFITRESLWWDDYLICVSFVLLLANVVTGIIAGTLGSGRHVWTVDMSDIKSIIKILFGYTQIYGADTCTIKLSLICSFVRFFHVGSWKSLFTRNDYLGISVIAGGLMAISYPIIICTVDYTICRPFQYMWDRYTAPGTGYCGDINMYYILMGAFTMVSDLYILSIPIYPVQKLQMPTSKKVMLIGSFGLGFFVCIASAMRIYYLKVFAIHPDLTWNIGPIFVWSAVEPGMSIVTACLITSMPAFARIWSFFGPSHTQKSHGATLSSRRSSLNLRGEQTHFSTTIKHGESDEIVLLPMDEESKGGTVVSQEQDGVFVTREICTASNHGDVGVYVTREISTASNQSHF